MRRLSILTCAFLFACAPPPDPAPQSRQRALTHTFDLAPHMPQHLAIMFAMAWFGLPSGEPGIVSPDPSYGNWKWNSKNASCPISSSPDQCSNSPTGSYQRVVASRRRPLAGIYSSSGRNDESRNRMDLMLSNLRRPCDSGARLDTIAVQLNGTYGTSLHAGNPQVPVANINLQALEGLLDRAEAAGMKGAVMPADDATWYFHFPDAVKLDCTNNKQSCLDAISQDIVDMVSIAAGRSGALQINGKPLLLFYLDRALTDPQDWDGIVSKARQNAASDFYLLATHAQADYFSSFDAIAPWIEFYWWDATSGATVREHAKAYTAKRHDPLLAGLPSGRVVFGGVAPGFDDFTKEWGTCTERQLPRAGQGAGARDPEFLDGEFDYLKTKASSFAGVLLETWDDWTEGTEFEPDVAGGTKVLLQLRDRLGELYGEPADAAGAAALDQRWKSFGQPRGCSGATPVANPPGPAVPLACPALEQGVTPREAGGAHDGAVVGGEPGGGVPVEGGQASHEAGSNCRDCAGVLTATGGCGCELGEVPSAATGALLLLLGLSMPGVLVIQRGRRMVKVVPSPSLEEKPTVPPR